MSTAAYLTGRDDAVVDVLGRAHQGHVDAAEPDRARAETLAHPDDAEAAHGLSARAHPAAGRRRCTETA